MNSNSTSLILSFLEIDVSADTIDNILKKFVIKDAPEVQTIEIDAISIRKGMKYESRNIQFRKSSLKKIFPKIVKYISKSMVNSSVF